MRPFKKRNKRCNETVKCVLCKEKVPIWNTYEELVDFPVFVSWFGNVTVIRYYCKDCAARCECCKKIIKKEEGVICGYWFTGEWGQFSIPKYYCKNCIKKN